MFDELNEIIKSDPESREKLDQFKINFRKKREKKSKEAVRRARVTAIVLGSSVIISLAFLFYAFKAKTEADFYQSEVNRLELKLEECSD